MTCFLRSSPGERSFLSFCELPAYYYAGETLQGVPARTLRQSMMENQIEISHCSFSVHRLSYGNNERDWHRILRGKLFIYYFSTQ